VGALAPSLLPNAAAATVGAANDVEASHRELRVRVSVELAAVQPPLAAAAATPALNASAARSARAAVSARTAHNGTLDAYRDDDVTTSAVVPVRFLSLSLSFIRVSQCSRLCRAQSALLDASRWLVAAGAAACGASLSPQLAVRCFVRAGESALCCVSVCAHHVTHQQ
jgi:hypothetical protein